MPHEVENMMYLYVILLSDSYKPMSYRLTIEDIEDYKKRPAIYKQRAIMHICANRGMTKADLKKYGYTTIRTREEEIII